MTDHMTYLRFIWENSEWKPKPQEPVVVFLHCYLAMVGPVPATPRPLEPLPRNKRMMYLELAQVLLRKHPSESTKRGVMFLLMLCRNEPAPDLPSLPWLEAAPVQPVQIDVNVPSLMRLAPVMRFTARHRWKGCRRSPSSMLVSTKTGASQIENPTIALRFLGPQASKLINHKNHQKHM